MDHLPIELRSVIPVNSPVADEYSAVIPGEQTTAAAISTLSTSLTSSPYTWTVNLAAGESLENFSDA